MTAQRGQGQRGFTLAEAALALAVVALVVGAMVPAFLSLRKGQQMVMTQQNMDSAMRAIAGFAQSRGCVPCPTPASRVYQSGFGVVRGDTTASPASCGTCSITVGTLPFASLGLAEAYARDGYGRWLTYSVDAALTANFAVIPPSSPCQMGDADPPCSATDITNATRKKGLCQAGLNASARPSMRLQGGTTVQAAVVLLSHGPNGRGAYKASPASNNDRQPFPSAAPACSAAAGAERCNADNDTAFMMGVPSTTGDDPFDDHFLYLDRNALLSFLGGNTCGTVW